MLPDHEHLLKNVLFIPKFSPSARSMLPSSYASLSVPCALLSDSPEQLDTVLGRCHLACLPNICYTAFRRGNGASLPFPRRCPAETNEKRGPDHDEKNLLLLLTILLLGTLALAEPEAFFDNDRINEMIDERTTPWFSRTAGRSWSYRRRFIISGKTASARTPLKWARS